MPVKGQKWEGQVRKMEVGEQVPQQDLVGHKVDKVMIGRVVVGLPGELCVTCPGLDSQLPDSRLDSGLPARESSDLPFPNLPADRRPTCDRFPESSLSTTF